jgi:hypothetical protein
MLSFVIIKIWIVAPLFFLSTSRFCRNDMHDILYDKHGHSFKLYLINVLASFNQHEIWTIWRDLRWITIRKFSPDVFGVGFGYGDMSHANQEIKKTKLCKIKMWHLPNLCLICVSWFACWRVCFASNTAMKLKIEPPKNGYEYGQAVIF